uniref:PAXX non-homologous end joining factor n=1 Tax=Chelydra serpentina TaxID=8475 RepID=A0A8C3SCN9_CHESE
MAEPAGPFYALCHGDHQYLCYCAARDSSGFDIYVTNASEVWSTDFTLEKLEGHKSQSGTCPSEDYSTKFREAFEHGAAALTVQDSKATLQLKEGTWSLTFDLFKLPCSEARKQLQALMFGLVGCVSSLEKRLEAAEDAATAAAASCSPEKNLLQSQRLLIPDLSPRKNRGGGSAVTAKRRVPGESLINPGFKSKKAPTGVDFEDS